MKTLLLGLLAIIVPATTAWADEAPFDVPGYEIEGEVYQPGFYQLPEAPGITLSAAIWKAGGLTSKAASSGRVEIQRNTAQGEARRIYVRVKDLLGKGSAQKDVYLRAGDRVLVPKRGTWWKKAPWKWM